MCSVYVSRVAEISNPAFAPSEVPFDFSARIFLAALVVRYASFLPQLAVLRRAGDRSGRSAAGMTYHDFYCSGASGCAAGLPEPPASGHPIQQVEEPVVLALEVPSDAKNKNKIKKQNKIKKGHRWFGYPLDTRIRDLQRRRLLLHVAGARFKRNRGCIRRGLCMGHCALASWIYLRSLSLVPDLSSP